MMEDHLTCYEYGLNKLQESICKEHIDYEDFLSLEASLRENIRTERSYGQSSNLVCERRRLITGLNNLTLKILGISFNDLCEKGLFVPQKEQFMILPDTTLRMIQQLISKIQPILQDMLETFAYKERLWPINCQRAMKDLNTSKERIKSFISLNTSRTCDEIATKLYYMDDVMNDIIHNLQGFTNLCQTKSQRSSKSREAICRRLSDLISYVQRLEYMSEH